MDLQKMAKKYRFVGDSFLQNTGRYAGATVDLRIIRSEIALMGLAGEEVECAIEELQRLCKPKQKIVDEENVEEVEERLREAVNQINPFQHFHIVQSSKFLVIWEKESLIEILGPVESLNATELESLLGKYEPEMLQRLKSVVAPILSPKTPYLMTMQSIIGACLALLDPLVNLPRILTQDEDIHPTVVEGCGVPALRKIKYVRQDVNFSDLNPLLQEFFNRVDNYKHMCAVIWGQLTGRQWPYICYLYGRQGREGKTSFISMLGELTKSYATLTDDSRFSLQPLYGKSIIMVPENDRSRFVSMKSIKAITGGNLLSIEEKGKNAFPGRIRGTIFVDANVPLKISGKSFETERLFYLTVKPNITVKDERLSPAAYITELGSTPNEFLNYCRQCCDELLTPGGMLREPDNHSTIMSNLSDYEQDYAYEAILHKLTSTMGLQLNPAGILHKAEFLSRARALSESKKDFYGDSFIYFLEKKGVKDLGKTLQGIGKIQSNHTEFEHPAATKS